MPGNNESPTVSFPSPVYNAAGEITAIRIVHVVVVKESSAKKEQEKAVLVSDIVYPLIGVVIAAALLVFLLMKIKAGRKTDRIIRRFEGFNAFFDGAEKKND